MSAQPISTTCCIAGGGPAGLMLGYLLGRAGIDVVVLEKHPDFLRDFRGDTIHPSTMQIMEELGMLDDFLKLPHQRVPGINARFGEESVRMVEFSGLNISTPFIAMMPQWDFLNFLTERARRFLSFRILMKTEATGLVREGNRVAGVKARNSDGAFDIRAAVTIAADGRGSVLRADAGLPSRDLGAPMDALWFRLSRRPTDTEETQARFAPGAVFVMLNRGDYWQCAYVISKGTNEAIREGGVGAFRDRLHSLLPFEPGRADEIESFDQVRLLVVQVNMLEKWWLPGFVCIGDAAHAMSPVGGVGVNLAVQDAVAAANQLIEPLRRKSVTDGDLVAIQRRREWPTSVTQRIQLLMQNQVIAAALSASGAVKPPFAVRVMTAVPFLRRIPARVFGLGVRQEHVSPALLDARP